MPDNTLDESLASANGVEVDLGSSGVETHRLFADVLIIEHRRGQGSLCVPVRELVLIHVRGAIRDTIPCISNPFMVYSTTVVPLLYLGRVLYTSLK